MDPVGFLQMQRIQYIYLEKVWEGGWNSRFFWLEELNNVNELQDFYLTCPILVHKRKVCIIEQILVKPSYIYNIFETISQQILDGNLLLDFNWTAICY